MLCIYCSNIENAYSVDIPHFASFGCPVWIAVDWIFILDDTQAINPKIVEATMPNDVGSFAE